MLTDQRRVRELHKAVNDLTEALRHHDQQRVYYLAACVSEMVGHNYRLPWSAYRARVAEEFDDQPADSTA